MALQLTTGEYVKISPNSSNFLMGDVSIIQYKDKETRDYEKTNGSLPEYTIASGKIYNLDSLRNSLSTQPLAGQKSASDEILTLAYSLLNAEVYPDATEV